MNVLVVGAVASDSAGITLLLDELGIPAAPPVAEDIDLRAVDLLAGSSGTAGLVERARTVLPAAWAFGAPGLPATLTFWREVAGAAGVAVVIHRDVATLGHLHVTGRARSALTALVLWEHRMRQILEALDGMPVIVVPPGPSAGPLLAAGLAAMADDQRPPGAQPAAIDVDLGVEQRPPPPRLSLAQAALAELLDGLVGYHAALVVPPLPSPSQSPVELGREVWELDQEVDRLSAALTSAVAAVERLMPADPSLPDQPPLDLESWAPNAAEDPVAFARWLARAKASRRHAAEAAAALSSRPGAPVVSIVLAVTGDVRPALLAQAMASILEQAYTRIELCVACASDDEAATRLLEEARNGDPRVKLTHVPSGLGLTHSLNAAVALSSGAFVGFLGQHDELEASAVGTVVQVLVDEPETDVVYTDEDKVDEVGERSRPFFKPDWSPDLLLSTPYLGDLFVVRRSVLSSLEGLRADVAGSECYDLALRATEVARSIAHVASIGYHRRHLTGDAEVDLRVGEADIAVIGDALERRGEEAAVEPGLVAGSYRVRRHITGSPLVTVVVPFRDGASLLRRCVESLHATSGYDRWEAVLVDNDSWEPETKALRQFLERDRRCRVVDDARPFNWSTLNNRAVEQTAGDLLLFLNSDIEGRSHGWMAAMVEHAQRPQVGAVGARLLYPDGRVQHSGVVLGLGNTVAWHAFCFCPPEHDGYFGQAKMVRNYSAATGACLMVRREVFAKVGGFDESLALCFNDVDFCLRVRAAGYVVVCTPFAELLHHESVARGRALDVEEVDEMHRRWGPLLQRDPYFNPNLDRFEAAFALPGNIPEGG